MGFVRKLYKKLIKKVIQNTEVVPDVEHWKAFLAALPEPKNDIDIAYNKFLCRMDYISPVGKLLMNTAAAGTLLVSLPRLFKVRDLKAPTTQALLLLREKRIAYHDVIPQELLDRYPDRVEADYEDAPLGMLCREARTLFFQCLRAHPFSFWFNLLILKELSTHSRYLLEHDVRAAAGYVLESNIAYPVVTRLYEENGRKFISFMHGEYLLQLIHGYMKFSEYYVWDPVYIDMFANDLNCRIPEYKVYTPKKLQKKWNLEQETPEYFCTYYFSGESQATIRNIAVIFSKLQQQGMKCKVRPHPRFVPHVKEIFDTFEGIRVEMPKEISLHDSLAQTRYAVGLSSTVLSEALIEGREIAVDDMSDPKQYSSLDARRAMVLNKKHVLLSELCRSVSPETDWMKQ